MSGPHGLASFSGSVRGKKEEKCRLCKHCVPFLRVQRERLANGHFTLSLDCVDIGAEFKLKTRSRTRTRNSTEDKTGVYRQISMWAPGFQEKTSGPDKEEQQSCWRGFLQSEVRTLGSLQTARIGSVLRRRTFRFWCATHARGKHLSHFPTAPSLLHSLRCRCLNTQLQILWIISKMHHLCEDFAGLTRRLCGPPVHPLDVVKLSTRQL